jgi:hypothetical protein
MLQGIYSGEAPKGKSRHAAILRRAGVYDETFRHGSPSRPRHSGMPGLHG